jgi:hypothetical protein
MMSEVSGAATLDVLFSDTRPTAIHTPPLVAFLPMGVLGV